MTIHHMTYITWVNSFGEDERTRVLAWFAHGGTQYALTTSWRNTEPDKHGFDAIPYARIAHVEDVTL